MKNKKKSLPLKCHVCGEKATNSVMIELRDRTGPPLKENNVIRMACDEHAKNTSFDYWVPHFAFVSLFNNWRKEGILLKKEYCTIKIVKLRKKNDTIKS